MLCSVIAHFFVDTFLQVTFHKPAEVTLTSKQVVTCALNKLAGNTVLSSVVSGWVSTFQSEC